MSRATKLAAWLLGAALVAVGIYVPTVGVGAQLGPNGQPTAVAIGELSAVQPTSTQVLQQALTQAVEQNPNLRLSRSHRRARYVLRGSVTRVDQRAVGEETEIRCAVALIVADNNGNIRATLSGRGGARGRGDSARLQQDAIGAAVRGALRPLGSQLR